MKKKALLISIFAIIISLFSVSYTFAANELNSMADGVRNVVGKAENAVEGVGSAIGNTVRDGMNTLGNGARDMKNDTENAVGMVTDNGNDGYTAERTSAGASGPYTGVSTTGYTWFIIAVTAIAIGILLWSYIRQNKENNAYIDTNNR